MQILETCGPQAERCFRVCTLVNGPNTVSSRFYRVCQEEYDINEHRQEEEQSWKREAEKKAQREKEEQENLRKDGNGKAAKHEEKVPPLRPSCGSI